MKTSHYSLRESEIPTAEVIDEENASIPIQPTEDMLYAYSLSRTVKFLAILDIVFSILYAFGNLYFFIPICLALLGYFGAKKYNLSAIFLYMVYNLLMNISRLGFSIYVYYHWNVEKQNTYLTDMILTVLSCILGLWITKIIYKFYCSIKMLTPEELNSLRILRATVVVRTIYW